MASPPKSFWPDPNRPVASDGGDVETRRRSHLDTLGLRAEADIIHIATRAGVGFSDLQDMQLWEVAAAAGQYLMPVGEDDTTTDVIVESAAAAAEHSEERARRMAAGADARRRRRHVGDAD